MSCSVLQATATTIDAAWAWKAGGDPKAIAYLFSMESSVGGSPLDVSTLSIAGSTSGTVSLANGKLKIVKEIATTSQNMIAFVAYVETADLSTLVGSTVTPTITYSGTPNGSANNNCIALAIDAGNDLVFDTSLTLPVTSAASSWSPGDMTVAPNSIQMFAMGVSLTSTRLTSIGLSDPLGYTEARDSSGGGHGFAAGYYLFNAGGHRGNAMVLGASDTGAVAILSLKEYVASVPQPDWAGVVARVVRNR